MCSRKRVEDIILVNQVRIKIKVMSVEILKEKALTYCSVVAMLAL
jgi:hypothetical protein